MFYAPPRKERARCFMLLPQRQRATIRDGFLFLPGMSTCQLILHPNQRRKAEIE